MTALLLMGLRGSGKSTVGRLVADELGCEFVDLDDRTLARLGRATVREAWESLGEPAFRAAELEALGEVLAATAEAVIALGGGTPMIPGFQETVGGRGKLIYLRADPEVLAGRIGACDANRPSLTGGSPVAEMAEVFERRDPTYRRLAGAVIDASGPAPEVAMKVIQAASE